MVFMYLLCSKCLATTHDDATAADVPNGNDGHGDAATYEYIF